MRKRTTQKHLPRRLRFKHGAYYHVTQSGGKSKWIRLGEDYGTALREWAKLEGTSKPQGMTVADAIAHYLEISAKTLSAKTIENYEWSAKALIPVFGEMRLDEVERGDVYAYMTKKGNVAANRDRALLSATYNHLLNAGVYKGENPCLRMQFRNQEKPRERYITDGELEALVKAASYRFGVLLQFAYATGMRQFDIITLKLTAATKAGIDYRDSKTGKRRIIEWTDELEALWKAAAGSRIGAQPVFLTRDGNAYTSSGVRASWRHVKIRAGLSDLHFHDIRRKSGSNADDDSHAQRLLGHMDSKVTRKHYRAKPEHVRPICKGTKGPQRDK